MKIYKMCIEYSTKDFQYIDNIMKMNGYRITENVNHEDGLSFSSYTKVENQINEFENIFDY